MAEMTRRSRRHGHSSKDEILDAIQGLLEVPQYRDDIIALVDSVRRERFLDDRKGDRRGFSLDWAKPGVVWTETRAVAPPKAKPPCFRESLTPIKASEIGWTITITPEAARDLWVYWHQSPGEVSGLGLLKFDSEPDLDQPWQAEVVEVSPLSQKDGCDTGASSGLSGKTQAEFYTKLCQEGKDPEQAKLFWHSHVELGCFFSSTDVRDWIEASMAEQRLSSKITSGWMVSVVVSGKGGGMALGCRIDGWRYQTQSGARVCAEWVVEVPVSVAEPVEKSPERRALELLGKPKDSDLPGFDFDYGGYSYDWYEMDGGEGGYGHDGHGRTALTGLGNSEPRRPNKK